MLDKLVPVSRRVYYGPNRGSAEWRAKGAFAWGCNGGGRNKDCPEGGFCQSLDEVRRAAEVHAETHPGMRAVYDEG